MLPLPCPFCGERPESEFICLGEAVAPRPLDPNSLSDQQWADYVSLRENLRGPHVERWWHVKGCNLIFAVSRDTQTHAIAPAGASAL